MPDRRKHRGPHPEDDRLFDPALRPMLQRAAADLAWLLSQGYTRLSALKLVGDRYDLLARQRTAVARCTCSDAEAARRKEHQAGPDQLHGRSLWLDGYNVLCTIEAALAGGVVLCGRDGTYRDMASMHGSYRKVAETLPALELLGNVTTALGVSECLWYLDRPVSNSGRLKAVMEELAAEHDWNWRVELVPDPDAVLADPVGALAKQVGAAVELPPQQVLQQVIVATADSVILDRCRRWFNLARETVVGYLPQARVVQMWQ